MSYHDLSECTLSPDERLDEAARIFQMIEGSIDQMTPSEQKFVSSVPEMTYCSIKQLFWLRDLKDKYL